MESVNPHIVIYDYVGVYQDSVNDLMTNFEKELINPRVECIPSFEQFKWEKSISLLVIPPGNENNLLRGLKPFAMAIQKYIKKNPLLALGNGVLPFSKFFYSHNVQEGNVVSEPSIQLFDIFRGAVVSPGLWQHENPVSVFNADAVDIRWNLKGKELEEPVELKMFHFSDPCFFNAFIPNVEIVATFSQSVPAYAIKNTDGDQEQELDPDMHAAVIEYTNPKTKAKAILCGGCRPEMIPEEDTSEYSSTNERKYHKGVMKRLAINQDARKQCIRDIFLRLGLPLKKPVAS